MQDASDVMQLLLKTQTDFSDMEDDDPQVKQLAHVRLCPWRSCGSCGVLYSGKELSKRLLEIPLVSETFFTGFPSLLLPPFSQLPPLL